MLTVKVLGSGCPNCQKVATAAQNAVSNLGVEAEIIKVTDYAQIMAYNVLATPGLVINEKLVSAGRIPSDAEVMTWVADALAPA
ncbi:MAG: TM0996/MTH895 family glutaredoxin-like protein [Ardenticatenaceae bacterium]|nr:TM0996/MTH895 family glutaredoxin-like protein [Ardenticatenaceae bacterium]MCB9444382.1 TM0996/MTH895 family glutaredoxin-like protein [Ardenticatenaceae bacterium]